MNNPESKFNFYGGTIEEKFLLKTGDLLFALSGAPGTLFGAHIWNGGRAVLNQHIFRIDFKKNYILKSYFRYSINNRIEDLITKAHGGAGLQHVTKGVFENTPIPLETLTFSMTNILFYAISIKKEMALCIVANAVQKLS